MKTIVMTIATPAEGDLVIINAEPPAGGKTSAKHAVMRGDSPADIAHSLASQISQCWLGDCAQAKVKPKTGELILTCLAPYADVNITTEVHGKGGTTARTTEF